ncbi:hypothetical protein F2P56_011600 [Juglans regia]|uniref:RNase H type-1 domain-containing protein n=2 Tax=Juglans regia TaxID=51240 RepID=A0A833XLL7_JUGRE|nr:uncharacterized protein LOC108982568 [Juglans regia]KAF5471137.1 hypothetical protein F2P56_011600 [Juglans regia]
MQNEKGILQFVFAASTGMGSNNKAELMALLLGLRKCKELGFSNVVVEMDSLLVITLLRAGRCSLWYLDDFWEEIQSLILVLNIQILHVFREANAAADYLARLGGSGCN